MPCLTLAVMTRKASPSEVHARGFGDIIGIVLIAVSVLMLVALFSYDPKDVPANTTDLNQTPRNWIGQVGAWLAFALYNVFGAGAYLLPVLLFCFGLSYLFQLMAYFHRRWMWAGLLLFCCMGLLDLNSTMRFLSRWQLNHNAISAGGWFGLMMNKYAFGHFGSVGATIIFVTLYLISLRASPLVNELLRDWATGQVATQSDSVYALHVGRLHFNWPLRRVTLDSVLVVTDSARNARLSWPITAVHGVLRRCIISGINLPRLVLGRGLEASQVGCAEVKRI